MTRTELARFIEDELQGLWPQWTPTRAELRVWMGVLRPYTFELARTALQQYFCQQAGNYHRPKPAGFLAKARLLGTPVAGSRRRAEDDPESHVLLECVEAPPSNPNRLGSRKPLYVLPASRQNDPDYIRTCAEATRQRFEHLYAGRWISIIKDPQPAAFASLNA